MTRLRRLLRCAPLVLGTGYILAFFSETVFWAHWRPDDSPEGRIAQWLLYSLMAYLTLAVIRHARIQDGWTLLLAGAFFGWIDEGVFAMTMFGDPSMPFPFTIAWTALAWHGPISLALGWYALGLALRAPSMRPALMLSLGFGVFWGLWAFGWTADEPPVANEPIVFLLNATACTILVGLAHLAVAAGRPAEFLPSRAGMIVAALPVAAFFALLTTPTVPIAPLVLLPLLGLLALALRRGRAARADGSLLAALAAPVRGRNLAALALMPLGATLVYGVAADAFAPSHAVLLAVAGATSLGGLVLFLLSLRRSLLRPA